jgi:uncharacterized membrane protein
MSTIASSMFTFIVFLCSSLLLVVQLASAQLTPRIISLLFRDPVVRLAMTVFTFCFTFTLAVLVRLESTVPPIMTRIAEYGFLASMATFLYLINHVGASLRANRALRSVGGVGRRVIESVYPRLRDSNVPPSPREHLRSFNAVRTVLSRRSGTLMAFDTEGLIALARTYDCLLEIVPQVGDRVDVGDPLFRVFYGGQGLPEIALRRSVAIGPERTFEQDPVYAVRIIVDIASRALSPAINDPTTAVLALDEIHQLLRAVGNRELDDRVLADASGRYRLEVHTPNWSDFVNLAVTEIRQYGAESIQISRRMRAMIENLLHTVPEFRREPLRRELELLRKSAVRAFAEPEDQAMAAVSDSQGVGGRQGEENGKTNGIIAEGTAL